MAAIHDFAMDQGSTWTRTLNCANSDGTPVDFGSGASAKMQVRAFIGAEDPIMEADCAVSSGDGTVVAVFTPEVSTAVNVNTLDSGKIIENSKPYTGYICYYDLEITWGSGPSDGNKTRLIQGRICINPEVTLD